MHGLPRIRLSGDLEGDYVVLRERAGGRLMIAPEQTDGLPKVVALERTTWACPTQWEGTLEDGRMLYARCRHGELSVGLGDGIDAAVTNGMSKDAFYFDHVEDAPMDFAELRAHLFGLLEFPVGLKAEDQQEPSLELKAFEEIFASEKSTDANPTRDGEEDDADGAVERVGERLREAEIRGWTCFSCGKELTRAHEGDYFHTDPDSDCTEAIPVPTSLVQPCLQTKDSTGAWGRD